MVFRVEKRRVRDNKVKEDWNVAGRHYFIPIDENPIEITRLAREIAAYKWETYSLAGYLAMALRPRTQNTHTCSLYELIGTAKAKKKKRASQLKVNYFYVFQVCATDTRQLSSFTIRERA